MFQSYMKAVIGAAKRAAQAHRRLLVDADGLLERIALDVLDQRAVDTGLSGMNQPAEPAFDIV